MFERLKFFPEVSLPELANGGIDDDRVTESSGIKMQISWIYPESKKASKLEALTRQRRARKKEMNMNIASEASERV